MGLIVGMVGKTPASAIRTFRSPRSLQPLIHHSQLVILDIAHPCRTRRVIYRMSHPSRVLADLLVGLNIGPWRDLLLDPVLEGLLLRNLAGGADAKDEGGRIVSLGVGKISEVERWLGLRIA